MSKNIIRSNAAGEPALTTRVLRLRATSSFTGLVLLALSLKGSAHAADITIPHSTLPPIVDGKMTTLFEYADASSVTFPTGGGSPVHVYVKHDTTHLYALMTGLVTPAEPLRMGPNAAVYVHRMCESLNPPNSPNSDTLAFSIAYDGVAKAKRGSPGGYDGPAIASDQYAAARLIDEELPMWSAEFKISQDALGGGWDRDIRIGFAQQWVNDVGDDYGWPPGFFWSVPRTWRCARLAGDGTAATENFVVTRLEVTQAIQNPNHTVPLIAGKRTFVRVHVRSTTSARSGISARLYGQRGAINLEPPLLPQNQGGTITVVRSPNTNRLDDAFLFELPPHWTTEGRLELRAEVNPGRFPAETSYDDNGATSPRAVTFVPTSPLNLALRNIVYRSSSGAMVEAPARDLDLFQSQLWRMFPVNRVNILLRSLTVSSSSPLTTDIGGAAGYVNGLLAASRIIDGGVRRIQLGMVTDLGGFMRGQAAGIPAWEAAGPTGIPGAMANPANAVAWDFDGSYGDWYGLHELGHALDRPHVGFFGAGADVGCGAGWAFWEEPWPYRNPAIGWSEFWLDASGFDAGDARFRSTAQPMGLPRRIYPGASWNDVMSYCENQWISAHNYTRIRDYINARFPAAMRGGSTAFQDSGGPERMGGDFLYICGKVDFALQAAELLVVSREPSVSELPALVPGGYALELQDALGATLASHAFTPLRDSEDLNMGIILQVIESVPGTRRLVVRSLATGNEIAAREVSPNAPTVSDVAHDGGFNLPAQGPITVSWASADADGDTLRFTLQYSFDSGVTWRTVATGILDNTFALDASELEGTRGALSGYFRVIANDGVNTGRATSAKFSVVGKAPTASIANPANGSVFGYGQCFALEAYADDFEDGTLGDPSIEWSSSLHGILGTGRLLHPALLLHGPHRITVTVTDSDGQVGTESMDVTILEDVSMTQPDALLMDAVPAEVVYHSHAGSPPPPPQTLSIRSSTDIPRAWNAVADASWIGLEATSGTTPADLSVTADPAGMSPGETRSGRITVTVPDATNSPQIVFVSLTLHPARPRCAEFFTDFKSGKPPGTHLYGSAFVDGSGGVGDTAVLKLTTAANDQQGSFIIDDFILGVPVTSFTATFKVRVGGGTTPPADGFSFNFANDLPNAPFGEEGAGFGLTVSFDTFDNGGGEAPAIDVKWIGTTIANTLLSASTGSDFVDVLIQLRADGKLDVSYDGTMVYSGLSLGYAPISGGRFGLGARTGGSTDNHWVDDLRIEACNDDAIPPSLVSAGSLDGATVGVCFSEAVSTPSAENPQNYLLWDLTGTNNATGCISATLRPDGRSVILLFNPPVWFESFVVSASNILDLAQNVGGGTCTGTVAGLVKSDIGQPALAGSTFTCRDGEFELTAGGSDIWDRRDEFQFAYKAMTNDFDVLVQVTRLDRADYWSKAGLVARESTSADSKTINALVTPNAPEGAGIYQAAIRRTPGALTESWGEQPPVSLPNAWVRLQRVGQVFRAYHGTNGVDWQQFAQTETSGPNAFSSVLLVGLAATSHNTGQTTTAEFRKFAWPYGPWAPRISIQLDGADLLLMVPTQAGRTYELQFTSSFNPPGWHTVQTVVGDGSEVTIRVPVGNGVEGYYRVAWAPQPWPW